MRPCIPAGVDFRLKFITVQDQRVKLTIWDTAGQERFRYECTDGFTLTVSLLCVYASADVPFIEPGLQGQSYRLLQALQLPELDILTSQGALKCDDVIGMDGTWWTQQVA